MRTSEENKKANRLANESSPYLLQHAYNPVSWFPWGKEALSKAQEEDKPIIASIGYSSCHWCHVMEREVFENEALASFMNTHFINIKIDREERPDLDQIYMEALQHMNLGGGWPLNIFLTPEGKPFYGGTYFPPDQWEHLLKQISSAFQTNRADLEKSAEEFTQVLNYSELHKYNLHEEEDLTKETLEQAFSSLSAHFDKKMGGMQKSPKFPMPSTWIFLLRYYFLSKNEAVLQQVKLTLNKITWGGIYDQIGGGFARYSTDPAWFAPHFEKMLYDNAQLISLYSEAYILTKEPIYKTVVIETIEWLEREMLDQSGGFYSALDADSEGEEGKFYVWQYPELEKAFGKDMALFSAYYNVEEAGNWEKDYNILYKLLSDKAFANKHKLEIGTLESKVRHWKSVLLKIRAQRSHPGLDDKILSSWNGLLLKGLSDAYKAFGEEKHLEIAKNLALFLKKGMYKNCYLMHSWKNGKASINGFLDDYAFVIAGYISLYEITFEEEWLFLAQELTETVLTNFFDEDEKMFFFNAVNGESLIARKKELFDNVIPSSNSEMALNLFKLGLLFERQEYSELSDSMLRKVQKMIQTEPSYTANWAKLLTYRIKPIAEIAISGNQYLEFNRVLQAHYYPNKILSGCVHSSKLPLLQQREPKDGETNIYVCYDKTCNLPVSSVEEAISQLK